MKLKPMPDFAFRLMVQFMKLEDIFHKTSDLVRKIPLKEGITVVDYGCGPGRYTIPIAKIVGPEGKVYAVDIQHLAIETVKKKAKLESLKNIEPILIHSFDTGIKSSSVDLVLLIDALSLIEDRNSLFKEVYRLLKPDGLLFVEADHMRTSTAKRIVENAGFFNVLKTDRKTMLISVRHNGQ